MHALRSCDFCDAEAAGTFEIVPPDLEPTEAEQRRVVLCDTCQAQLETLLEPLLERAGATAAGSRTGSRNRTRDNRSTQRTTGPTDRSQPGSAADRTQPGSAADRTQPDTTADRTETGHRESRANSASNRSNRGRSDDTTTRGITVEGEAATDRRPPGSEPAENQQETTTTDDEQMDGLFGALANAGEDSNESQREQPPERTQAQSPTYRKVCRLLRNREFPVDRTVITELASNAYDLEPTAVESVIDTAVANGEFDERGGKLYR